MLMDNKDIMMQERMVFEERIHELVYENSMLQNKVEDLYQ
jgi:hypothetical protein